ncbi:unnamed protein product, partial [Ectocarpus sp. 8 AP-2014]
MVRSDRHSQPRDLSEPVMSWCRCVETSQEDRILRKKEQRELVASSCSVIRPGFVFFCFRGHFCQMPTLMRTFVRGSSYFFSFSMADHRSFFLNGKDAYTGIHWNKTLE